MKKLASVLMLAMFVLSIVPAVFAVDVSMDTDVNVEASSSDGASESTDASVSANARTKAELKEKMEEGMKTQVEKREGMETRVLSKIKIEKAREHFLDAQEKFLEAKAKFETARLKFESTKEDLKKCKGEECKEVKIKIKENVKERLLHQAEIIIAQLERILDKYDSSEEVSEDTADTTIADLNARIELFKSIKAEIEAADTKEELVAAAHKLRDAWNDTKHNLRLHINVLMKSRMAGILNRIDQLETKLNKVLERMKANGKDTSTVDPLVVEFKAELKAAEDSFDASQKLLAEAAALRGTGKDDQVGDLVQQAQEKLKEAKEHLKNATELLRKIMHELRGQDEDLESEDDNEASDEQNGTSEENEGSNDSAEAKTKFELEGEGNASEEVKAAANALFESLKASNTEAEITVKAELNENNESTVSQKVEGTLSADQQTLLDALVALLDAGSAEVKVHMEVEA